MLMPSHLHRAADTFSQAANQSPSESLPSIHQPDGVILLRTLVRVVALVSSYLAVASALVRPVRSHPSATGLSSCVSSWLLSESFFIPVARVGQRRRLRPKLVIISS